MLWLTQILASRSPEQANVGASEQVSGVQVFSGCEYSLLHGCSMLPGREMVLQGPGLLCLERGIVDIPNRRLRATARHVDVEIAVTSAVCADRVCPLRSNGCFFVLSSNSATILSTGPMIQVSVAAFSSSSRGFVYRLNSSGMPSLIGGETIVSCL